MLRIEIRAWQWLAGSAIALVVLSPLVRASDPPSAYDRTEHGGFDANNNSLTGVQRPPNEPVAGFTVAAPPGDCAHCHDQHASLRGVPRPAEAALLFKALENQLCVTCHNVTAGPPFDQPRFLGWAGAQRGSVFAEAKHADPTEGAQWLAGNSLGGVANVINSNQLTPAPAPGARRVYDPGSCLSCHSAHGIEPHDARLGTPQEQADEVIGSMLVRTLGSQFGPAPAEANALCNTCHDNTARFGGGEASLASKSYSYKGSQGVGTSYSGFAGTPHQASTDAANLWPGGEHYPARAGEKGTCLNCHDPHGGAPAGAIGGAPGGTRASNRTLVAPLIDAEQPSVRNTLCVTCHNQTSGAGAQPFRGQALYQQSSHGSSLEAIWGRTADPFDGSPTGYDPATALWGPRSETDHGLCLNCHNPHTETITGDVVDGSTTAPRLLLDSYHAGNSTSVAAFDPNAAKLCFSCHSAPRLTEPENPNTAFRGEAGANLHALHNVDARALCNSCHNPHGPDTTRSLGSLPHGGRDMAFNMAVATPSAVEVEIDGTATRGPVWFSGATVGGEPNQAGCLLSCHGHDHAPTLYDPAPAPDPASVSLEPTALAASPQPTAGAGRVVVSLSLSGALPRGGGEYEYALDAATGPARRTRALAGTLPRPERRGLPALTGGSRSAARELAFEVPVAEWRPGASRALFVRPRGGGGSPEWLGTVISVTDPGAPPVALAWYLDEALTQPAPTPRGTPALPLQATAYLKLHAPAVQGYTLEIEAPGQLNDAAALPLRALSATEAVAAWPYAANGPGRVRARLRDAGGRLVEPGAGGYALLGEGHPEIYFELEATPEILDADGQSQARVLARLTDANGQPLPSRAVDFRRHSGGGSLLPQSPVTDRSGAATALYLAGVTAETAEIEVVDRATGAAERLYVRLRQSGSVAITLSDGAEGGLAAGARLQGQLGGAEPLHVTLDAYPRRLPADGVSTALLVARVHDARGAPKAGVFIRFEVAGDNGHVATARLVTDAAGRVEAAYLAGRSPGDVTITASDAAGRATAATTLVLTGGGLARVAVEATPATLPADGQGVAQVTVRVTDLQGRPVSGAVVELLPRHGFGQLTQAELVTDALGEAVATFRAGLRPGVETLVASALSPVPEGEWGVGSGEWGVGGGEGLGSRAGPRSPGAAAVSGSPGGLLPLWLAAGEPALGFGPLQVARDILDNVTIGYGRWDDYVRVSGPSLPRRNLHLSSNLWSVRFDRPMDLGFGGLTVLFDMDRGATAQYGIIGRHTNWRTTLRLARPEYVFLGSFTSSDTQADDLRTGIETLGQTDSTLLSLTLRPPGWPMFTVRRFMSDYESRAGEHRYGYDFSRTDLSLYYPLGDLGLRWSSTDASQRRDTGAGERESRFRYQSAGVTLAQDLLPGLALDVALTGTGSRTRSGGFDRETKQTNSNVQLRLRAADDLTVTASRSGSDVEDTAFGRGPFSTSEEALQFWFQPAPFLSLQATRRQDDYTADFGRSSTRTDNFGAGLVLTPRTTLTYFRTAAEEPEWLNRFGQRTDSRSLQLVHRQLLPGTDLLLSRTDLETDSALGATEITTHSARLQSQLTPDLRAAIGFGRSDVDGRQEELSFGFASRDRDLSLVWSPLTGTDLAYVRTNRAQTGQGTRATSALETLRLTTRLTQRGYLVLEAANNRSHQQFRLLDGLDQRLYGSRFAAQINYVTGTNSYLTLLMEQSRDDLSGFRMRRFRIGFGTRF